MKFVLFRTPRSVTRQRLTDSAALVASAASGTG